MAADALTIQLVAADRTVWSGEGTMVSARTVEGDLGILKDHAPLLSVMAPAEVEITADEGTVTAVVDGGFISVAANRVSILAERALLVEDLSLEEARSELQDAEGLPEDDEHRAAKIAKAEVWVRAAERA